MAALQNTLMRPETKQDVVPLSECRRNLTKYFKRAQTTHRPILVTQDGGEAAIVMNVKDFEDTWNVWESVRDNLQMKDDVEAGIHELDEVKCVSHDEVFKNLLKEFMRR